MNQKEFPDIVKNWMQIVEDSFQSDPDRLKEYCEKLKIYAEDNGSPFLKGFCFFYLGFSRYIQADLDGSMQLMSEAFKYFSLAEDWLMAGRTYNAMGNISTLQGDTSLAIDCFLKGLAMARSHGIHSAEYTICGNIANIQMSLGDHKSALTMLKVCEKMTDDGFDVPAVARTVVLANICVCYTHLGELELAAEYLNRYKATTGSQLSSMDILTICMLETQLYNCTGDIAARDAAIAKLDKMDLKSLEIYDSLTELHTHAQLLLDIGKFDEFHSLLRRMSTLEDNPSVKRHILELQMKLCKLQGDVATYAKLAMLYYDVSQQHVDERNRIVSHNIITRIRLDDEESRRKAAEKTNVVLRERSEHDALTGLNNRFKLNELSEDAFQRSYLSRKPLTVEILDIDCYKLFNDNYGHQAGDDCLVQIAEAIRSMEEYPGVHTGRYGGDEFVLVYEEYTKEEVENLAAILRQKIIDLNIEHKHSTVADHVTISQGLFHCVPVAGNKLWDFMYCADMALYIVKRKAKNYFHVGTDFNAVRDEYNELARK